jgi:hypothetical protein
MAACGEEDGEDEEEPIEEFTGTYRTTHTITQGEVTETIVVGLKSFKISDTTNATLDFKIDKWEIVETPAAYKADYPSAFKFTGTITAASAAPDTYIPSLKTAPNFSMADVGSNTEAWMSVYFNYDKDAPSGERYTVIRTPFSKAGNVNSGIVTNNDNAARIYNK